MANYTLDQTQLDYYQGGNFGGYQYVALSDVIDNFIATYVGDEKILGRTRRSDVNFHAHRAFQELHYDTFKSCKSQEIEVCPNLKMPLPQDYVNYVKLTWVDDNGIEHIIYPTSATSNPFPISQSANCGYEFSGTSLKQQEACDEEETVCTGFDFPEWEHVYLANRTSESPVSVTVGGVNYSFVNGAVIRDFLQGLMTEYCTCLRASFNLDCGTYVPGASLATSYTNFGTGSGEFNPQTDFITQTFVNQFDCVPDSDTRSNWSDPGSSPIEGEVLSTDISTSMFQYQNNGSFYIDCLGGNIHFSSNMAGHTIILKYISDGLGTEEELIVPKLAEEAMYKWIAYGCLSAKADIPEYLVARFKKEKYAETRKAKIRLSNIKIEEITQIFRAKAEQIKY